MLIAAVKKKEEKAQILKMRSKIEYVICVCPLFLVALRRSDWPVRWPTQGVEKRTQTWTLSAARATPGTTRP